MKQSPLDFVLYIMSMIRCEYGYQKPNCKENTEKYEHSQHLM